MQPIRRRLFASVSVLSLFLCLATVGLWVRSYWIGELWTRVSPTWDSFTLSTVPGSAQFSWGRRHPSNMWAVGWSYWSSPPSSDGSLLAMGYFPPMSPSGHPRVRIPFLLFTLLFALAPAWWLLNLLGPRRTLHRRRKLGLCLGCAYDLRASPERCPECGRVAAMQNAI